MPSLKKLFSDTMIYGMSSIIGRFLNYLLVPLYTYKIAATTGGYGTVTRIYALTALMLVILTFGMETTFFYFANKYRDRSDKVFFTVLTSVGTVSALFVLLLCIFNGPVCELFGSEYTTLMGAVVALDAFQAILFARLRFEGRAWKFALLKLLFIFCNIGLNLFVFLVAPKLMVSAPALVRWYNPDNLVGYIFITNFICTFGITFFFLPELLSIRRIQGRKFDPALLREMLRYTWPLLLFGIAGILNQVADKICYNFIVPGPEGDVQLGIYGACVKIAMIMAMITQAFRYAYEPFVFGGGKSQSSKESQALVMKYFIIFALLAYLVVVAYIDIFRYVISPTYWEGLKVVPIVMMAEIFMSIYFNLSFWYKLIEQTWWGAIFSAIGCIVLLAIIFLVVPRYGYMACAWGGFAGYGVCVLLSYFVGHRKSPVPYPLKTIGGYFALALGLYALSVWLKPASLGWELAFNTLLLLVYIAVVCYAERALLGRVMGRLLRRK